MWSSPELKGEHPHPVTGRSGFYRRSLVGLFLLAVMSTSSLVLMEWALHETAGDPATLNVAGHQRALNQQVRVLSSQLGGELSVRERLVAEGSLAAVVAEMRDNHSRLTDTADPDFGGTLSPELRAHFFQAPVQLDARLAEMWGAAEQAVALSRRDQRIDASRLAVIVEHADRLAPDLGQAVLLFEEHAGSHIHSAAWIQRMLCLLMLAAVAALWVSVFRPMMAMLVEEEAELAAAQRHQSQRVAEQEFMRKLNDAMEMRDEERDLMTLTSQALLHLGWDNGVELLLADSSKAHMRLGAAHPTRGAPGCRVDTPWQCTAVRRGRPIRQADTGSLDACPQLRGHTDAGCAAVCVPVTFMGEAMGVLHTVSTAGDLPPPGALSRLEILANGLGARLGAVRSFKKVQLQASTDPLTGLLNRRALEEEVRSLVLAQHEFAVCIADLDHFKRLNDTHGHDTGDRALGTFSKAVREVVRDTDLVSRFGGEEFVIIFPDLVAEQAQDVLERLRQHLATVTAGSDTPTFTASYGVSDTRCGSDLQALIQIADAALLRAKEEGRDQVIIADMGEPNARPPELVAS